MTVVDPPESAGARAAARRERVAGWRVGLVDGLIITKLQVNAFIATLGTALIIKGLIDNRWDGPAGNVPQSFSQDLGYTRFGVLPVSIFLFAAVVVAIW